MNKLKCFAVIASLAFLVACESDKPSSEKSTSTQPAKKIVTPEFSGDSAFAYTQAQIDFGHRIPGTEGHRLTGDYIVNFMKGLGLKVLEQTGTVNSYDGKALPLRNIFAQYKPEAQKRVMLFAHWDTRPFADRGDERRTEPILGANDGASGVAGLMELARAISQDSLQPNIGVDFMFFDVEDYGEPQGMMTGGQNSTWCLGSQYWGKNRILPSYQPMYGICLDMIGAKNAVFPKEGTSMYFAPNLVDRVWGIASKLGYGNYFVSAKTGGITDDHLYVNQLRGIPAIDIIHYDPVRQDFGEFHHTHNDDMSIIDKAPMEAVGDVLLYLIYSEE